MDTPNQDKGLGDDFAAELQRLREGPPITQDGHVPVLRKRKQGVGTPMSTVPGSVKDAYGNMYFRTPTGQIVRAFPKHLKNRK